MLAAILIIIAASVSFSVVTLLILFYIGKCPDAEQTQDDDSRYTTRTATTSTTTAS